MPDDVLVGPWRVRCKAKAKSTGATCRRWAVRGGDVCPFHGAGGKVHHPDDIRTKPNPRTLAAARLEEMKQKLMELGPVAMDALGELTSGINGAGVPMILEPKDRLKAIEIVLDRLMPKTLAIEDNRPQHRDLDEELAAAMEVILSETG